MEEEEVSLLWRDRIKKLPKKGGNRRWSPVRFVWMDQRILPLSKTGGRRGKGTFHSEFTKRQVTLSQDKLPGEKPYDLRQNGPLQIAPLIVITSSPPVEYLARNLRVRTRGELEQNDLRRLPLGRFSNVSLSQARLPSSHGSCHL